MDLTHTILNGGTRDLVEMLLADRSLACMAISAQVGVESAALIRTAGLRSGVAGRLADVLDESVLLECCLLNVPLCDAAAFVLGDIADTALPEAVRAGELAAFFREKSRIES
jgi:hypothetical protein